VASADDAWAIPISSAGEFGVQRRAGLGSEEGRDGA